MIKIAAIVLKIGVHLHFDPKFTVEFEHFDQKYFRQAYWVLGQRIFQSLDFNFPRYILHTYILWSRFGAIIEAIFRRMTWKITSE